MTLRVISLGAGVQSTTMALMAAHGEIGPMPNCAIFADTGWEPRKVYEHLEWLETKLPFPVMRVSAGSLRDKVLAGGYRDVPFYSPSASDPSVATMGRRQCTHQFKLRPIRRKVRDLLGGTPRGGAEMWIGISTDEVFRVKDSSVKYIQNRHPLIERRMSRGDCREWLWRWYQRVAPRSACRLCPFQNAADWRALRESDQEEWVQTLAEDDALRADGRKDYAHRSLLPLREVDFSTAEDRGQLNMFNNECEGMCGV